MAHRPIEPERHAVDRLRPSRSGWSTDGAIRLAAVAAVLIVALVAAYVSYQHALDVVRSHGEDGLSARLVPLTVDGMIAAAGMVFWQAARQQTSVPALAYVGLWGGILATVVINVAHGWPHGIGGALVGALPAVAFIVAYETLMRLLRASRAVHEADKASHVDPAECLFPHFIPDNDEEAVRFRYKAALDGWTEERSQRQLATRFRVPRPRVREIVAEVDRERLADRVEDESPNGRVDHAEQVAEQVAGAQA